MEIKPHGLIHMYTPIDTHTCIRSRWLNLICLLNPMNETYFDLDADAAVGADVEDLLLEEDYFDLDADVLACRRVRTGSSSGDLPVVHSGSWCTGISILRAMGAGETRSGKSRQKRRYRCACSM